MPPDLAALRAAYEAARDHPERWPKDAGGAGVSAARWYFEEWIEAGGAPEVREKGGKGK